MLTLMSFGNSLEASNQMDEPADEVINCWESANDFANEVYANTGDWDYADLCFDVAFTACTTTVYGLGPDECIGC